MEHVKHRCGQYKSAREEEEALLEAIRQEQVRRERGAGAFVWTSASRPSLGIAKDSSLASGQEADARYHQQQGRRRLKEAHGRGGIQLPACFC